MDNLLIYIFLGCTVVGVGIAVLLKFRKAKSDDGIVSSDELNDILDFIKVEIVEFAKTALDMRDRKELGEEAVLDYVVAKTMKRIEQHPELTVLDKTLLTEDVVRGVIKTIIENIEKFRAEQGEEDNSLEFKRAGEKEE